MNALEATSGNFSAGLKHESETKSELEKQFEHGHRTEAEEAFQGPKFDPPVYRRRYAAVCELVKKHQAKKVLDFGCAEAKLVKVLTSQEQLTHLEEVVGVDIDRELLERNEFRIKPLISDYLRPRSHPFKVSLYQENEMHELKVITVKQCSSLSPIWEIVMTPCEAELVVLQPYPVIFCIMVQSLKQMRDLLILM
ncbi:uncharacterized protein [Montipora capricornis]|uniref:uncharacterized protein isoform X3 n=1 Tax=Montipora capricornis TaxID=246305 RepID=UPI0035F10CAE